MTIEEIKEWRNTVETHGIGIAGEFVVEIIDTLLEEVATLEKHNASSDQAVVELDQKLTIATEALESLISANTQRITTARYIARTALERIKG